MVTLYRSGESWALTDGEQAATLKTNEQFGDFGPFYQWALERFVGDESGIIPQWRSAADICYLHNISRDKTRQVGRAMTALANQGMIEMRTGRANTKQYFI